MSKQRLLYAADGAKPVLSILDGLSGVVMKDIMKDKIIPVCHIEAV